MADKQQYKLIFENWRKFQSLKEKEDIEISQTPLTPIVTGKQILGYPH